MKDAYELAMELCKVRDALEPIVSGEITRGHAHFASGDYCLNPGKRKTKLKDARTICTYQTDRLNRVINALTEYEK